MYHSIRFKFFAAIGAIAVIFIGILTALNVTLYDNYYLWQRERTLKELYRDMCTVYVEGGENLAATVLNSEDVLGIRLAIISHRKVIYDSVVREQPSSIIAASENIYNGLSITQSALNKVDMQDVNEKGAVITSVIDHKRNEEFLCLVGRLSDHDEYLVARIPFMYMEQNSAFNMVFLLISGGITLIVCTFLAFLISRHFTRPLIKMGNIANSMAALDFSQKYDGSRQDEIGWLGQSLNRLSEHLEKAIEGLRKTNAKLANEIREKERVDEMRQEFIVNVSHELKTPIALIQGYAEGLREGIAETPEDIAYYCTTITDEAVRMNNLVMQLMNLSKLELGRDQPTFTDIDLDEFLQVMVNQTALLADSKNLTVEVRQSGLHIFSDYGMVEQVIGNYLSNAIRYTPEHGKICLSAAAQPDGAQITVFNEGEGVTEQELPRLWEKFYRTDKARSRESGGSGVGLSIVKATADLLGGAYGARNVPGGMEFWFLIPEHQPNETP